MLDNKTLLNLSLKVCMSLINASFNIIFEDDSTRYDKLIIFHKEDFFHLIGLEKLKDLTIVGPNSKYSKTLLFQNLCKDVGNVRQTVLNSAYFAVIRNRLESIINLRKNFQNLNNSIYEFEQTPYSQLDCDYLLKSTEDGVVLTFYGIVFAGKRLCLDSAFTTVIDCSYNQKEIKLIKLSETSTALEN